ncbi:MAG: hypothetical protein K2W96_08700, partial [Gemmataceae bacterium]|nr:hypothetical protein [Gemmataceae bacterium]
MPTLLLLSMIAVAPPARPTADQIALWRARERVWLRAQDDWKAGRQADAFAGMGEAVRMTVRLVGEHARLTANTVSWLAGWEEARGEW